VSHATVPINRVAATQEMRDLPPAE
jgi:hypothetical protein